MVIIRLREILVLGYLLVVIACTQGILKAQINPVCPNLVVNGDFRFVDNQNCVLLNFGSDMLLDCEKSTNGPPHISLDSASNGWNDPWWVNIYDHTPGGGTYMMIGDQAADERRIWYQNVFVQAGKIYEFSAWFINASAYSSGGQDWETSSFEFKVGGLLGQTVLATGPISNTSGWTRYAGQYTPSSTGIIELAIVTPGVNLIGYDFVMDDIEFREQNCSDEITILDTCIFDGGFINKITNPHGPFGADLEDHDHFGCAVEVVGDLDGDGVTDLAVGAFGDDDGHPEAGCVYILFMNQDGTVRVEQKISATEGNFTPATLEAMSFGHSIANLGDLDGDGVVDLAVGAMTDYDGGFATGAVFILFLNTDGTVKTSHKISDITGTFLGLEDQDLFGASVENIGDLNNDGVTDLAVGAIYDDDGGTDQGAVYILFLNQNGSVKSYQKISDNADGFSGMLHPLNLFGSGIALLSDLDGDGNNEIAVGAYGDTVGVESSGSIYILFLTNNGMVKKHQKISAHDGNFSGKLDGQVSTGFGFGVALASVSDINGDGVNELAVSMRHQYGSVYANYGGFWLLYLNKEGTVEREQFFAQNIEGIENEIEIYDLFGSGIAFADDSYDDNRWDFVVGALADDNGGIDHGAIHIISFKDSCIYLTCDSLDLEATITIDDVDDNGVYQLIGCCGSEYLWGSSGGLVDTVYNPKVNIVENTLVELRTTDDNGCVEESSLLVEIDVKLPNIITPNDDALNDYFEVSGIQVDHLQIFNRWGKQVFATTNYQNDWNAEGLVDGLYYYSIQSPSHEYKGWVEVSR